MLITDASHLPRLMVCGGSLHMQSEVPPEDRGGTREEGIAAHWLAEQLYKTNGMASEYIGKQTENGIFVTDEMADHVAEYLTAILSRKMNFLFLETSANISSTKFMVKTRADCIASDGETLFLDDLKYGYRFVEPHENYTLIAQAIAFELKNGSSHAYYSFTIHQPRGFNHPGGMLRNWTISRADLESYYWKIHDRLNELPSDLVTSAHCYKCPGQVKCHAARAANMNSVDVSTSFRSDEIDNDVLSFELDLFKRASENIKQRLDALEELARYRLKQGQIVNNYALENQQGNRAFHKHLSPEMINAITGFDLTEKKLITPAKAQHLGVSELVINSLSSRSTTGVKLVRRDLQKTATKQLQQKG
jgi:hypothetical protein